MNFKLRQNIKSFKPESYVKESSGDEVCNLCEKEIIDCSLGVNPYGHSNIVNRLFKDKLERCDISSYPLFPYIDLKKEIIRFWEEYCTIENKNIRFGCGSMEILQNINRVFIEKDTKVLGVAPTFTSYTSDVKLCEGIFDYELLSENENFKFDIEKFLARINPEYTLIYIDNPNNPTGQVIPLKHIKSIAQKAIENDICVLIDEAYGDFMDASNSAVNLVNAFENIIVSRTFSKGFGLAGVRIGYMIADEYLSGIVSKVNMPFTINNIGHLAAIEALKDCNFTSESRLKISRTKKSVIDSLRNIKVLETNLEVPIMTLYLTETEVNLYKLLKVNGVLTESGEDFHGLDKNFIRMRVPKDAGKLISIINKVENYIAS